MTAGPFVMGLGMLLLARVAPGTTYVSGVLPGVLVVGTGLTITVAPLTTAVLGAVDDSHAGIASAINNAVARIAGLLAVAIVPAAAGLTGEGFDWTDGFDRAMVITAATAAVGGIVSWFTIRKIATVRPMVHPSPAMACQDPSVVHHPEPAGQAA
jgi:hypothetical protein